MSSATPSNVVMLLTPPGAAAIAVVRIAGPGVRAFLAARFSTPAPDGRCVHGLIRDEAGGVLDDAVVVCSAGQTVADLNLHGGAWVVESVFQLAERCGFTRAEAAAGSEAANGDAGSPLEREVLERLPTARTALALRTLLAQPLAWEHLRRRGATRAELEGILKDESLVRLLDPPRVAIVGAANVGKSTLANQLFARERSITADLPGTTRDWVGELAEIDGVAVMLVDTPGVRDTPDDIERQAIARSAAEVDAADCVVVVWDATRSVEPEQGPLLRRYGGALLVVNKMDLNPSWDDHSTDASIVATAGKGIATVRRAILNDLGCNDLTPDRPRVWTERQRAIVERAVDDPDALDEL